MPFMILHDKMMLLLLIMTRRAQKRARTEPETSGCLATRQTCGAAVKTYEHAYLKRGVNNN